jgi:zinc D-Ala-D-Ala carboxypeptidase
MNVIRKTSNGGIQLSPNFWLSEFTDSSTAVRLGIDNAPDPLAQAALFKTAALMEEVRALLGGKPIIINSGYRGLALNKAVGGSRVSDHLRGEACDFRCPAYGTPLQIAALIAKSGIKFGQLIFEGTWVHISLPNRGRDNGQVLTAKFTDGKAAYSQGLPL